MKTDTRKDIHHIFVEAGDVIDEALKQGVRDAMIRHKKDGLPVVIYRDGKTVWVKPEDLGFQDGTMMNLGFTVRILKENGTFIAHVPELDVSSCGDTEADTRRNIADAVQGFLETAREQGTLNDILQEAGYRFENDRS